VGIPDHRPEDVRDGKRIRNPGGGQQHDFCSELRGSPIPQPWAFRQLPEHQQLGKLGTRLDSTSGGIRQRQLLCSRKRRQPERECRCRRPRLQATGTPATPTAKTHSIPQFAFGGGFASTLYFTNSTDAEVTFDAAFFRNNGSALEVGGAAIQSVKIPARGLAVINAPNEGALTQGWAGFNLPDGVTGFNRLRQITENQADRELIIPITKTNEQQKTLVVFDDTVINTQLVVANPGSAEATITATVRDDQGATIGTSEFKLAAGAKVVVLLKDRVADAAGKRGTIELTTSTSAVSALAIRFDGTALVATEALIVDEEVPEE
jgi:hypothetical protein